MDAARFFLFSLSFFNVTEFFFDVMDGPMIAIIS